MTEFTKHKEICEKYNHWVDNVKKPTGNSKSLEIL